MPFSIGFPNNSAASRAGQAVGSEDNTLGCIVIGHGRRQLFVQPATADPQAGGRRRRSGCAGSIRRLRPQRKHYPACRLRQQPPAPLWDLPTLDRPRASQVAPMSRIADCVTQGGFLMRFPDHLRVCQSRGTEFSLSRPCQVTQNFLAENIPRQLTETPFLCRFARASSAQRCRLTISIS